MSGLQWSLDRSCRGAFRATFFGFFGAGATFSVASGAATAMVDDAGASDATGAVASARAVSTAFGATAIMVADVGGRDVTRDGTSERAGVTYDVAGCTMVATDGS